MIWQIISAALMNKMRDKQHLLQKASRIMHREQMLSPLAEAFGQKISTLSLTDHINSKVFKSLLSLYCHVQKTLTTWERRSLKSVYK